MKSIFFFLLLVAFGTANATNFYVDPSSTASTQNGSITTPWKSLTDLNNNFSLINPGDFVYFKRGQVFTGVLNIRRSGTATSPITYSTYGTAAEAPVFTGSGEYMIHLNYVQYVIVDGLKITDLAMNVTDHSIPANLKRGVNVDGSHYNIIRNCDISLVGTGFNIMGSNNKIENCIIQNLRMIRNTVTSINNNDDYGAMGMVITGSNNEVLKNQFYECWANSYDYVYDGGGVEIFGANSSNNKIMYNTAKNCNGFMEIGSSNGGTSANNIVAYNKLVNCGDLIWINNSGSFAITVNNLQFYNNVIVETVLQFLKESKMIGIRQLTTTPGVIVMKNNIFWLMTGVDVAQSNMFTGSQLVHENNIYRLGTNSVLNFTASASELVTTAAIFTNTTSTDPLSWNYRPGSGSPAISFGQYVGITRDFENVIVPVTPNAGLLQNLTGVQPIIVTATNTAISCNAGTSTVTVTATGGTAPYTGTGTFTVGAGTYTYTVRDANNVSGSTNLTISQPAAITATLSNGAITTTTGRTTVTITASGGTPGYTYSMNGGAYQTSNVFSNVGIGTHSFRIQDSKGCVITKSLTLSLTSVTPLVVTATAGTIACKGGTTTVVVAASGGTAPYSGTGSFTVNSGTYTYTVTDAIGGSASATIIITQPDAVSLTISSGTITVNGGTTSITASTTGGSGVYTYKLGTGAYQSSNVFSGLGAGTYSITAKDSRECTTTKRLTITEPPLPFALNLVSKSNVSCRNRADGRITVAGSFGYPPYTYRRAGVSYTSSNVFSNLAAGTYTITGRDSLGNTSSISVVIANSTVTCTTGKGIIEEEEGIISTMEVEPVISVHPNPSQSFFRLTTGYQKPVTVNMIITDLNGKVLEQSRHVNQTSPVSFGAALKPGVYILKSIIEGKVSVQKLIKL